jgi:hypothetical protein
MMSDHLPYIGVELEGFAAYELTCSFAPFEGDPICGKPATLHLATEDYTASVRSCDVHVPIARATGCVREHSTTGSACGMPQSMWIDGPPSRCELDGRGVAPELLSATKVVQS